jgi:Zn-dependent protease
MIMRSLTEILFILPGILIGLSMHEFGHALVAHKLGDPTPERDGRLTLSPLSHIDPIGLIFIILVGFGWARPVRITPSYFKNPKRDHFLVAFAGPLMNLLAIVFFLLLYRLTLILFGSALTIDQRGLLQNLFVASGLINAILLFFNLLPIHPLDGFTVLSGILPYRYHHKISFLQQYGNIILIIVLIGYRLPVIGQVLTLLVFFPARWIFGILYRILI